ncbi:MAG TPA: hypothetical protein VGD39_12275 [Nocardioides sp.]
MSQPASGDPLHYRLMEALDDLEGPVDDTTVLCDALRAVLGKLVDIERGLMSEVPRKSVTRHIRFAIAEQLGVETRLSPGIPLVER